MTSSSSSSSSSPVTVVPLGDDADWWRTAVVYQIYPRSFADADGDGVGDLAGITSRAGYLRELGVDAVWLSPYYPSALADGGYDVDDHRDVHPALGSLDDFDEMSAALHRNGLRLIVDIVPNHTSDRHPWFREALAAAPGSPARGRYVFLPGTGPEGSLPPSDWTSHFGGSAWERLPDGEWYLHLFAREQPDLNWRHPEVRQYFLDTLRFWADRGVDGFRVDVAHTLVKDLEPPLRSQTTRDSALPLDGSDPLYDRDEVHEIFTGWRAVMDEYAPPRSAVAEAWVPAPRRPAYARATGLGQAFNFDLLRADWDPGRFEKIIRENLDLAAVAGTTSTWVLSNHDVVRHATRYGLPAAQDLVAWLLSGGQQPSERVDLGLHRARAATQLMLALPGSAYLYQGEELGLREVADLPAEALQDPKWTQSGGAMKGRDGCRVPLPWSAAGSSFGFGAGAAHLPQPDWFAASAVSVQDGDAASTLSFYRAALALRREHLAGERLDWLDLGGTAVAFTRDAGLVSITNFGTDPVPLPPGQVLLSSRPIADAALPADATAWILRLPEG